ncbi:MAG: GGDEF domain-containing protein [Marinomonas sp.]
MISVEQMAIVLNALPDPAFILSRSGKYVAVFGGRDERYYHDGSGLVGLFVQEMVEHEKACWFLEKIAEALDTRTLLIQEYELGIKEVNSEIEDGPTHPIWFEGRIQPLDFQIDDEDVVLWVASNITERHEMELKLRELSDTDKLTGLFNRRKLERNLIANYEEFKQQYLPMSVLMFDLDNLKKINDTFGHYVGDEVIMAIGHICRAELKPADVACRFGGDEFVIALSNLALEEALEFAALLYDSIKAYFGQFFSNDIASTVGVSIGVSAMLPTDHSYENVLKRADDALYQAKRSGKGKVITG